MAQQGPCKDCPNRTWDCHGKCETYLEFFHKKREEGNERGKMADFNSILGGIEMERTMRINKCVRNRKRRLSK